MSQPHRTLQDERDHLAKLDLEKQSTELKMDFLLDDLLAGNFSSDIPNILAELKKPEESPSKKIVRSAVHKWKRIKNGLLEALICPTFRVAESRFDISKIVDISLQYRAKTYNKLIVVLQNSTQTYLLGTTTSPILSCDGLNSSELRVLIEWTDLKLSELYNP